MKPGHKAAMAGKRPPYLGLLADGDRRWIAGVNYINNLRRILSTVESSELVTSLLRYTASDPALYDSTSGSNIFTFRKTDSRRRKLASLFFGMRSGTFTYLEDLVTRLEIDVVLPSLRPLGAGFPTPWIGWIPDLQHRCMPELFAAHDHRLRDESCRRLLEEASGVMVSSRTSAANLAKWFPTEGKRVFVLPFVSIPEPTWFEPAPQILKKYGISDRFFFFPSQFWTHKNHETLFRAIEILVLQGHRDVSLVCTGTEHDYRHPNHVRRLLDWVSKRGLDGQIRRLGLIPRSDQIQLMRLAVAVVQPSLFEGWSYLVEDARALGKPIILSDIPVHREQDPPNASYFDALDAETLASRLHMLWSQRPTGAEREREEMAQEREELRRNEFRDRLIQMVRNVTGRSEYKGERAYAA